MDARLIERIETDTTRGAAALFAGAVGYAAYGLSSAAGLGAQLAIGAAGAGALAFVPCSRLLGTKGDTGFALPEFEPCEFGFVEAPEELLLTERVAPADELLLTEPLDPNELVLTDADRAGVPLVLDDILAELGPDSRVVRLFDRKAMGASPTPGQLQSRISDHLRDGAPPFAPPNAATPSDASQALSAALAELRRSLR